MNSKIRAYLAIESSCDETAVALVAENGTVLSEVLQTQIETHRLYGGVVPEVASRAHFEALDDLVRLLESKTPAGVEIVGVAATCGPGLIGPLLVGACYGEGWARGRGCAFIGVHHLRAHLASSLLGEAGEMPLAQKAKTLFPAVVLLVSGGHTQILEVDPELRARKLADTADDAAGECFDKSAKLMGLPYPGGPEIEKIALQITPALEAKAKKLMSELPRPRSEEGFSFSGLKTAIRLKLEKDPTLARSPEFCWAIQEAIADTLIRGLDRAFDKIQMTPTSFVLCGGVAANVRIRSALTHWARSRRLEPRFPPLRYSTDNAVMVGAAAWVQSPELALREVVARMAL